MLNLSHRLNQLSVIMLVSTSLARGWTHSAASSCWLLCGPEAQQKPHHTDPLSKLCCSRGKALSLTFLLNSGKARRVYYAWQNSPMQALLTQSSIKLALSSSVEDMAFRTDMVGLCPSIEHCCFKSPCCRTRERSQGIQSLQHNCKRWIFNSESHLLTLLCRPIWISPGPFLRRTCSALDVQCGYGLLPLHGRRWGGLLKTTLGCKVTPRNVFPHSCMSVLCIHL